MRRALLVSMWMLAVAASDAAAQERITLDIRAIGAVSTGKLADAELNAAAGLGGTIAYRLQQHLHVYAGWDWVRFASDESFAGNDRDFEETGYSLGFRFQHPLRGEADGLGYRLEAGATYKHVEIEDGEGEIIADSGHGLGFEVGGGLTVPMGAKWQFVPALRYRSLRPEFSIGATTTEGTLRYAGIELGFSRRF